MISMATASSIESASEAMAMGATTVSAEPPSEPPAKMTASESTTNSRARPSDDQARTF